MKITIETIPHENQRYRTLGDWIFDENGNLNILVSETGNDDYNLAIAIHEMAEAIKCREYGIDERDVYGFDLAFEEERELKLHGEFDEPGDDVRAPYHNEHLLATKIEKSVIEHLGHSWEDYENTLNKI